MNRKLGNRAVLRFSPLETAYQQKFGLMPDYHYDRLREQTGDREKASYIVNKNMDGIWINYRIAHAIGKKYGKTGVFVHADDAPF